MINTIIYTFENSIRIITYLDAWNVDSCNLGNGGESKIPKVPVLGQTIMDATNEYLLPYAMVVIRNGYGYGELIHGGISMGWFPDDDWLADYPSDDSPRSDFFQVDSGGIFGNSTVEVYRGNRVQRIDVSFAEVSDDSSSISTHVAEKSHRTEHGGVLVASNITNGTASPRHRHKKFPIDRNGDCDLPSLILMTATGPDYDDGATHGMQKLNPTDAIWSPSTRFYLIMQLDCNLVLYDTKQNVAIWASHTVSRGSVCHAALSMAGELLVFDAVTGQVYFRSKTACESSGGICWTDVVLQVQNDGNAVLYMMDTNDALWSTQTVICDGGCY
ncbi:hypothetical protein Mapa_001584 [Marchantia paleacea]|nr:hypothetical protein Mapa_001584 [Marchantia paleacea]